jgi:hypothetical protein
MLSRAFSNTRLRFPVAAAIGLALVGAVLAAACTITTVPPASNEPPPAPPPVPAAAPTDPAPAASAAPAPPTATAPTPSGSATYNPCGSKQCGERCNLCPPSTPGCFETALVKMCHPDGQCKPATTVDCAKPAGG